MKITSLLVSLTLLFSASGAWSASLNGFDLTGASVPLNMIRMGGPPRDGIPSIDNPLFDEARSVQWLADDERILGVSINGDTRAYPVAILNWHEIVNDVVGGQPVVVTFCPLCNTGMVFDARLDGEPASFGVSGLLFESDVLLYDRESESLWSQIWAKAITGEHQDKTLDIVPVVHTTWKDWREQYPDTQVLSRETGFRRDYLRNPYAGYEDSPTTLFPVANKAPGPWHSKEWVMGVTIRGEHKAYPFEELARRGEARFTDELAGQAYTVIWDAEHRSANIERDGELYPSLTAFWFAWYAFYPDTEIFVAQ